MAVLPPNINWLRRKADEGWFSLPFGDETYYIAVTTENPVGDDDD